MKYNVGDYLLLIKSDNKLFSENIGYVLEVFEKEQRYIIKVFNNNLIKKNGNYWWGGYNVGENKWIAFNSDIEKKVNKNLINFL